MADLSAFGDLVELLGWLGKKTRRSFLPKEERDHVDDMRISDYFIGVGVALAFIAMVVLCWVILGT